jgi:tRNA(fMet)-specific endonuclease VapC
MKYLFGTDICIYIIKKRPENLLKKVKKHKISDIGISTITLSELEYGIEKSSRPIQNRMALNEFLSPMEIYFYDNNAAMVYGKIRSYLEKKGIPIGPLDTLIAAHCLSLGFTLVTNNDKEFKRIPDLNVGNWVK